MPVSCEQITDLVAFRDLRFKDNTTLDDRVQEIARLLLETIKLQLDTPVATLEQPEVYTIFWLQPPLADGAEGAEAGTHQSMETWLGRHQREVAALLVGERNADDLSDQEVQETLAVKYCYYRHDLIVLDWDAAFVVDTPEGCRDVLYVLEVANLQLEELTAYDRGLDKVLDKAYDDVVTTARPHSFRQRHRVLADLRETRIDLMRVADELSNITKFIGDWHLCGSIWAVRLVFICPSGVTWSTRSSARWTACIPCCNKTARID